MDSHALRRAYIVHIVEPHFLICLGNAHRPSIRQEYTLHHLASRIHDLGTFCLSASLTMTLQRRSYLQAHPASGETGVDFYPASPLYSEQSGYDKRELENGSRNVRAKGMLEVLAEEQYPVYKL